MLDLRLKGVEDIPHPSANAAAIALLIKLFYATGKSLYKRYAEIALEAFSAKVSELGIHAGHYFCSLDAYFNMVRLTVEAHPGSALADAALSLFAPYVSIAYSKDRNRIVPCMSGSCYEPVENEEQLKEFIRSIRK